MNARVHKTGMDLMKKIENLPRTLLSYSLMALLTLTLVANKPDARALSWDDLKTIIPFVATPSGPGIILQDTFVEKVWSVVQIHAVEPGFRLGLERSRDDARRGASSIPPKIRRALSGFFRKELLDNVRYKVGDRGVLNLARLSIDYGDADAVTLIDTIVFKDASGAASNAELWAHEMQHVDQFDRWGVRDFAKRYLRMHKDVELEAAKVAFNWWRQSDHALALIRNYLIGTYGMSTAGCPNKVGPASIVLDADRKMIVTNECGQVMPVGFVSKEQFYVAGGKLVGNFQPAAGAIYWSNNTQWYSARDRLGIIGQFPHVEGKRCDRPARITIRSDGYLVAINECDEHSTLRLGQLPRGRIRAADWRNLGATIQENGSRIRWDNGTVWSRFSPAQFLVGPWTCKGKCQIPGGTARVTLEGVQLFVKNENNQRVPAAFDSSNNVIHAWGLRATIENGNRRINWHNGTIWVR